MDMPDTRERRASSGTGYLIHENGSDLSPSQSFRTLSPSPSFRTLNLCAKIKIGGLAFAGFVPIPVGLGLGVCSFGLLSPLTLGMCGGGVVLLGASYAMYRHEIENQGWLTDEAKGLDLSRETWKQLKDEDEI